MQGGVTGVCTGLGGHLTLPARASRTRTTLHGHECSRVSARDGAGWGVIKDWEESEAGGNLPRPFAHACMQRGYHGVEPQCKACTYTGI